MTTQTRYILLEYEKSCQEEEGSEFLNCRSTCSIEYISTSLEAICARLLKLIKDNVITVKDEINRLQDLGLSPVEILYELRMGPETTTSFYVLDFPDMVDVTREVKDYFLKRNLEVKHIKLLNYGFKEIEDYDNFKVSRWYLVLKVEYEGIRK